MANGEKKAGCSVVLMLLFLAALIILFLIDRAECQTNRLAITTPKKIDGRYSWDGDLTFHKKTKIADGSDSLFTVGTDSVYVAGVSDTVWSCVYRNKGRTSLQFEVTGSLTSTYIEIWIANTGDYSPGNLPEKYFRPAYWIVTGTGMDSNFVATSKDSITSTGVTLPIYVPLLDGEFFKVLFITSPVNGAAEKAWLHAHVLLREGDQ